LLVSGFNVAQALRTQDPAAVFLLDQWVRYALGPDFHPATSLPAESLKVASRP
ncbi:MAG: hypothetical protein IT580_01005, partial [Verrucomicrobiales bacterium]|nr:hypothetical protein [Verrucomicrobiales bacterium]